MIHRFPLQRAVLLVGLLVLTLVVAIPRPAQAQGTTACPINILMFDSLILRTSPSFGAGVSTTLVAGEYVCLVGRTNDTTWLQVWRPATGIAGWGPANAFFANVPFTILPVTGGTTPPPPPPPPTQQTYVVQRGDTVFSIARRFNVTIPALVAANNIGPTYLIYAGQTLIIPTGTVPPPPPTGTTYVVRQGDFLVRIAAMFGLDWRTIATANNIVFPYIIYPGQVLLIPGR